MTRKTYHRTLVTALGGVAAFAMAAPAMAQTSPAAPGQAYAADEIIVSARRRNETLQETPLAITAINAAALEDKAAPNIGDLQGAAPNVLITAQNAGAAAANTSIRGLAFADIEKTFEPTVAIVVDGVFVGTSTGQYLDFFDISQIEVMRGPQGTLFGRNTIGGVINIQRTRPTGEFGGKVELTVGDYGSRQVRTILNTPIIEDTLAMKLFAFYGESQGWYEHGITGEDTGGNINWNYGASFLWTPTSTFDALLTLEQQEQEFEPANSNITATGEVFCGFIPANECNRDQEDDLYTTFQEPALGEYTSPALTLEMNWDLGAVRLTSVTGYRESDEDQTQDFDASSTPLYYVRRLQEFSQFSQELRAAGNITDNLDYVAGVFYYESEFDFVQFTGSGASNVMSGSQQISSGKSESMAVFADFDWQFAEDWRLSFGGRWTQDEKSYQNGFAVGGPFAPGSFEDEQVTPKVSLDWQPTDDLMFYAAWSQGYRAGGFSNRAQTAISSATSYDSETVDAVELGMKSAWFDNRLLFNAALFRSDYSDLQQNTTIPGGPTGNETIVFNVGSAEITGLEFDITARPTSNLTLTAAVGLLESEFDGFITEALVGATLRTFDYSAVDMIYSPEMTASIGLQYARDISDDAEWRSTLQYRYLAEYDQQIALPNGLLATAPAAPATIIVPYNDPRVRAEAQNLVDATSSLVFPVGGNQMRVTVFGRNLLDDRGTAAAFTVAGLWSFAAAREPRTFGVQLGYEF